MRFDDQSENTTEIAHQHRRFAVAWRNIRLRQSSPVALLDFGDSGFTFQYLATAHDVVDFRPFIGFPSITTRYQAKILWPFFALRVMDRRRPDFSTYLQRLDLLPNSSQLDILSRNGGERKGDNVQLVEEPPVAADGHTETVFLVRGARYAADQYSSISPVGDLRPGDRLEIRPETTNATNAAALLVTTISGSPIGWVPDLLIGYVQTALAGGGQAVVVRNNGSDAPWHLRFLVRVSGQVPAEYRPFTGDRWLPSA